MQTDSHPEEAAGNKWPQDDTVSNQTQAAFGLRTCREGLDLYGQLGVGFIIIPLGHAASEANYPLDGKMVTILFRAKSN